MSKKKSKPSKNSSSKNEQSSGGISMKEGTKRAMIAILFFLLAILTIFSAVDRGGVAGQFLKEFFTYLFGIGFYMSKAKKIVCHVCN